MRRRAKRCELLRDQVRDGVSPDEAKKALTLYGLSKAGTFPDDKLRYWHMRLLARVEREGLPR